MTPVSQHIREISMSLALSTIRLRNDERASSKLFGLSRMRLDSREWRNLAIPQPDDNTQVPIESTLAPTEKFRLYFRTAANAEPGGRIVSHERAFRFKRAFTHARVMRARGLINRSRDNSLSSRLIAQSNFQARRLQSRHRPDTRRGSLRAKLRFTHSPLRESPYRCVCAQLYNTVGTMKNSFQSFPINFNPDAPLSVYAC